MKGRVRVIKELILTASQIKETREKELIGMVQLKIYQRTLPVVVNRSEGSKIVKPGNCSISSLTRN